MAQANLSSSQGQGAVEWHKSTCPYCGLGCGLMVAVEGGKVTAVRGMKDHPTNNGDICILPANYPPVFTAKDRLTQPLMRRNGELMPVSWDEAITHTAGELRRVIEHYGPGAVAFLRRGDKPDRRVLPDEQADEGSHR